MTGRVKNGDAIFIYIKVNFPLCVHAKYTLKQDRKEGKMDWKEITEQIREVIRQIKINFPVTLNFCDTINIDIYGLAYRRWTPLSGQPENRVKLWARLLRTRLQAASANG